MSKQTEHSKDASSKKHDLLMKILGIVFSLLVLIFIIARYRYMQSTDGYFFPRDADDWAAWGTWVGGIATAGAFFYTLAQIREQRQLRMADEAHRYRRLRAEAELLGVFSKDIRTEKEFYGVRPDQSPESVLFTGSQHTFVIRNKSKSTMRNIVIGYPRPYALPPRASDTRPVLDNRLSSRHELKISTEFDVPGVGEPFASSTDSLLRQVGFHLEVIEPGESEECTVTFDDLILNLRPDFYSFTDASGVRWFNSLTKKTLTYLPDSFAG